MNNGNAKWSSGRMDVGLYALNKLASAGVVLLLLTVIGQVWPAGTEKPAELLGLSMEQKEWVYGYALIASLVADALLSLLPKRAKSLQIVLYAAVGFGFFALFNGGSPDQLWIRAVLGAVTLLLFLWGKYAFPAHSLITPVFAIAVPLLCWAI